MQQKRIKKRYIVKLRVLAHLILKQFGFIKIFAPFHVFFLSQSVRPPRFHKSADFCYSLFNCEIFVFFVLLCYSVTVGNIKISSSYKASQKDKSYSFFKGSEISERHQGDFFVTIESQTVVQARIAKIKFCSKGHSK